MPARARRDCRQRKNDRPRRLRRLRTKRPLRSHRLIPPPRPRCVRPLLVPSQRSASHSRIAHVRRSMSRLSRLPTISRNRASMAIRRSRRWSTLRAAQVRRWPCPQPAHPPQHPHKLHPLPKHRPHGRHRCIYHPWSLPQYLDWSNPHAREHSARAVNRTIHRVPPLRRAASQRLYNPYRRRPLLRRTFWHRPRRG